MATGLVNVIKNAAMDAMHNAQMCDLRFGKVISTVPLKVQVTNQFTIPESLLVVPEHLTNYELEVTTNGYGWITEEEQSHKHELKQIKQKLKIHGELEVGDRVALLRATGGQSYYILDRI